MIHPSYKPTKTGWAFDIALLVLDKPAKTKPAALAPANFKMPTGVAGAPALAGNILYAAGWGDTESEELPTDLK